MERSITTQEYSTTKGVTHATMQYGAALRRRTPSTCGTGPTAGHPLSTPPTNERRTPTLSGIHPRRNGTSSFQPRPGPYFTLSGPFLAPTSLPERCPKSARVTSQSHTDQRVTRGQIKRLDCSIGWRRTRCGCVSSVVIENYRHIATRKYVLGWWPRQETPCQDNVRTPTIRASTISPEGHHEHPESFQDRTH